MKPNDEKSSTSLVRDICDELGLDPHTQLNKLRMSIFAQFLSETDTAEARIDTDVIRMWLASLVSREQVRPDMRKTFDEIRQLGSYELREAWEVSELPFDAFNQMVVNFKQDRTARPVSRILH